MSETGRSRPGFREDSADQGDVLVYCPAGVFDPDNPEIRALAAARVGAENNGRGGPGYVQRHMRGSSQKVLAARKRTFAAIVGVCTGKAFAFLAAIRGLFCELAAKTIEWL